MMVGMDRYRAAGVDYEVLDRAKRDAIEAALATSHLLQRRGGLAIDESRGEPAFVFEIDGAALAVVTECLGTKSLAARTVFESSGVDHFEAIGFDTVAAIVNDVVCVGALPLVVNAYFATGAPSWMEGSPYSSLVAGFRRGCEVAGTTWGGGETPTLSGIVDADQIDLAGAAIGRVPADRRPLLGGELSAGDQIVLLASSGIHTNGISLARQAAESSSAGWDAVLATGQSFAEALLTPSNIYVPFVEQLFAAGAHPSYLTHITGHGWRKLMRPNRDLTYRIADLPRVPEVISFIIGELALDDSAAYGTFNMGAGFAVYCREADVDTVLNTAAQVSLEATVAGVVENGPREVRIDPINVNYTSESLNLRSGVGLGAA